MKLKCLTLLAVVGITLAACGSSDRKDEMTDSSAMDTNMSSTPDTNMTDSTKMDTTTSTPVDTATQR